MSNFKRWWSIALGGGLAVLLLVGLLAVVPAFAQGPMHGPGWMTLAPARSAGVGGPGWMMQGAQGFTGTTPFGGFGPGWMMQGVQGFTGTVPFGFGPGMMMGGMMNSMMSGMMINSNSPFFTSVEPLSLAETTDILNAYIADVGENNLALDEVMIFDNHAYAEIIESDTGIGVMEVLVDPATKTVYPEMGPNMMWNLKYGMMSGFGGYGMMGMMMGNRYGFNQGTAAEASAEMPLSADQAVEVAQEYLAANFPQLSADEHADPFYGYYTLHVQEDGETVGMLSVNGYSGQVFPHTWHGELIEMSGE